MAKVKAATGWAVSDPLLTLDQAAELVGVSSRTIRIWITDGRLVALRIGPRAIRVRTSDIEALARLVVEP